MTSVRLHSSDEHVYSAAARPHLEYCIQVGGQSREKDIDTLERIQRRETKIIPELRDLSHEKRLTEFVLTILEKRRLQRDNFLFLKHLKIFIEIVFSHLRKIVELEDTR